MQFYRVEVRVLPPDGRGAERTRSVLRRFSHFTKLHAKVRQQEALLRRVVSCSACRLRSIFIGGCNTCKPKL